MRTGDTQHMSDHELRRAIEKNTEYAADAMRYGGPGYARAYQNDLAACIREQDRRRGIR